MSDTGELRAQLDALRRDVDRLIMLVDGDEGLDIEGLRQRMDRIEELADEVGAFKNLLRGIAIGLGVTGVGSIGTLIALLSKALGGP
jgi:hypothetical protein